MFSTFIFVFGSFHLMSFDVMSTMQLVFVERMLFGDSFGVHGRGTVETALRWFLALLRFWTELFE